MEFGSESRNLRGNYAIFREIEAFRRIFFGGSWNFNGPFVELSNDDRMRIFREVAKTKILEMNYTINSHIFLFNLDNFQ